jgi:hypothetical protein
MPEMLKFPGGFVEFVQTATVSGQPKRRRIN